MAIGPRRLGLAHFAFYRAYLEGSDTIDLTALADRYLETGRDPRLCRSVLFWLQDELAAAARRMGDREAVRLLRLPKRLGADPDAIRDFPSLDDFRQTVDADGVYSEAELLALYRHSHPEPTRSRLEARGMRLRARRFDALRRLESAVAEPPASTHTVDGWLDPVVAMRLRAVGIVTLAQLVEAINASGHRWYRKVPRVGPRAAARVVRWLNANAASLTPSLHARSLEPIRQQTRETLMAERFSLPLTQLAPIEALHLPQEMSGAEGHNRAPHAQNQTGAAHDAAAIDAWLTLHDAGSHTWRSYRTQAERIVLWSVFERGKALSSLDRADVLAYQDFLSDPPAHWRGQRATPRWSAHWRPFTGPLAPASRATAVSVLKSLFQWLVQQRYLNVNPWLGTRLPEPERQSRGINAQHALTEAQWHAVSRHAHTRLQGAARERACVMLLLGYATGLRLAEMASATLGALETVWIDDATGMAWTLRVSGKGRRTRQVPIPAHALVALRRYLVARGLPDDPLQCAPGTPLIGRLSIVPGPALGAPALAAAFKKLFTEAARDLAAQDPHAAQQLAAASTHWLRHTHGARAVAAGVPLDVIQENLGHASLATTAIYATTELKQRIRVMATHFGETEGE